MTSSTPATWSRSSTRCCGGPARTVKRLQAARDWTLADVALRAQVSREVAAFAPGGVALFLAAGFAAWMKACAPLAPAVPQAPIAAHRQAPPVGLGGEVVHLL